MQTQQALYNVGGVRLAQPFKIRRLGHFGLHIKEMPKAVAFYCDLLGFRICDTPENLTLVIPPEALEGVSVGGYWLHHGTDHHSLALFEERLMENLKWLDVPRERRRGQTTVNQISWQVGSLAEVVNGYRYFQQNEVPIRRVGRDMPGSNWHVYPFDPDGHVIELFYGMEQLGWQRRSKPAALYRGFGEAPSLPQISEETELQEGEERGADVSAGYRSRDEALPAKYDVEGVLLPRPFKITKVGPVHVFVDDVDQSVRFYTDVMGFKATEEVEHRGRKAVFLRCGTEHHSVGLFPKALQGELGTRADTTLLAFGLEVGSYQQLRDAVAFLKEKGVTFREIPQELRPGIDYAAYAQDPEGHLVLLYYYMEQVGWDGQPRPKELRRPVSTEWPEALEPLSDTYADQTFQGPLG
ncbi:MAG: VOC family protein [Dehalococcoidia bacterium]